MFLTGIMYKEGRHWLIEVPALNIMTQGYTKKEALEMISDAVELHVNKEGFKTMIIPLTGGEFLLGANDQGTLVAFMLKRQRIKHNLSLSDMARRLGSSSKNAYARYEHGQNLPSLTKIQELLSAMSEDAALTFNVVEEELKRAA